LRVGVFRWDKQGSLPTCVPYQCNSLIALDTFDAVSLPLSIAKFPQHSVP